MTTSVFSNLIWKSSEQIPAQGISFIVSIVLVRLLMPEQFGLIALVMIFINIANAIVVSGFNTALIQKKDADELDFSSVFWLSFVIAIIMCIIIWFGVIPLSKFYNNELIVPVFRVLSFRLIISSFNTVQHAYVARHLQFKKYFWSTLWGTLISAVVGIYLAIKGYGVWALVFQYLTNSTIDTIVLLITVEWKPKFIYSIDRIKELFAFGWKILADSIFGTIQDNLRNFIIGKNYTNADLAYYTKSQQVPNLFITNITMSITSVLLPVMSNSNDDKERVKEYIKKSSKLSAYVIFPMLIGLSLVSYEFVNIILTNKWNLMVPYLQLYCIICLFNVLMSPRNEALKSIGRSDVFFAEHTIFRFIDIFVLIISVILRISPYGLMITYGFTRFILLSFIVFNAYKFNDYKILKQILDLKNTFISCLFMMVCVFTVNRLLSFSLVVMLLLKCVIGLISYIFVSILFKFDEFYLIFNLIKKYLITIKVKIVK